MNPLPLLPLLAAAPLLLADPVSLGWEPYEDEAAGFFIHWGASSGQYTHVLRVPDIRAVHAIIDVAPGTWYAAMTAYNAIGLESDFSPEISWTLAPATGERLALRDWLRDKLDSSSTSPPGTPPDWNRLQVSEDMETWRPLVVLPDPASVHRAFFRAAVSTGN